MRALALLQRIERGGIGEQQIGTVLAGTAAIELALQPLRSSWRARAVAKAAQASRLTVPTTQAISKPARRRASTVAASAHGRPSSRVMSARRRRALPGVLQGVHAATLRRALLAIQRSSANSSTMASNSQGVGSRSGGVAAGNAAWRGAWSVHRPGAGRGGCSASSSARGSCGSRSAGLLAASQSPGRDSR
jgi:hypothetical protein